MNLQTLLLIGIASVSAIIALGFIILKFSWQKTETRLKQSLLETLLGANQQSSNAHQQNLVHLQAGLQQSFGSFDQKVNQMLLRTTTELGLQFEKLNHSTQQQLHQISGVVAEKLSQGFEKTTTTFTQILERLAVIDEAQKKITELSKNVVSLQEVLSDKRSRGAFGEVQLKILMENVLPPKSFELQYTLSNGMRADCIIFLPEPTGRLVIDAKFPLENFKRYLDNENSDSIRQAARQQFKLDVKKHILDISTKYILPGETGEGALMFIPAEAVFAEIHAHHPDLVELGFKAKVWLASPSTMMAILTTAAAVIKDAATKQQVHVIQSHLRLLAQDFSRFEKRMDQLSKHIQQAHDDAALVHTSAKKITQRFTQIEKVELPEPEVKVALVNEIVT